MKTNEELVELYKSYDKMYNAQVKRDNGTESLSAKCRRYGVSYGRIYPYFKKNNIEMTEENIKLYSEGKRVHQLWGVYSKYNVHPKSVQDYFRDHNIELNEENIKAYAEQRNRINFKFNVPEYKKICDKYGVVTTAVTNYFNKHGIETTEENIKAYAESRKELNRIKEASKKYGLSWEYVLKTFMQYKNNNPNEEDIKALSELVSRKKFYNYILNTFKNNDIRLDANNIVTYLNIFTEKERAINLCKKYGISKDKIKHYLKKNNLDFTLENVKKYINDKHTIKTVNINEI